ncbi:MAG TPA: tol-pal system protein YbgF [Longimicrobiales bacterium]|nr:tol-pal system protein YbgF [Longimicrobiales bacterium]
MNRTARSTTARFVFAAAVVAFTGGCATKGDLRNVQLEIRALAARQDSLLSQMRRDMLSTQDTVRGQSLQLFDFRGEIFRQLREIADGLSRLEALTGENQRGIAGVRDQMANLRRGPAGGAALPGGVEPGAAGIDDPGAQAAGGDPEAIFNAAVGAFNRGSLSTARTAFQQFLQSYPGHPLAPDANFFLADILVQENRLEDALEAFQRIPQTFPTASKVPDAMYRAALLQIELDKVSDARATLERIVNTYPGTGVAVLAAEKLREIR